MPKRKPKTAPTTNLSSHHEQAVRILTKKYNASCNKAIQEVGKGNEIKMVRMVVEQRRGERQHSPAIADVAQNLNQLLELYATTIQEKSKEGVPVDQTLHTLLNSSRSLLMPKPSTSSQK